MIDEMLAGIFGEMISRRLPNSTRTQLLIRLFFGLLGAGLGAAGAVHFVSRPDIGSGMRFSTVAMFFFLSCFFLFNVALARKWRWPGILFIVSFVSMFVIRIVFGP